VAVVAVLREELTSLPHTLPLKAESSEVVLLSRWTSIHGAAESASELEPEPEPEPEAGTEVEARGVGLTSVGCEYAVANRGSSLKSRLTPGVSELMPSADPVPPTPPPPPPEEAPAKDAGARSMGVWSDETREVAAKAGGGGVGPP